MGDKKQTIGMFDSGIGGLSIYNEVRKALPEVNIVYIADQKYFPFGSKTKEEIKERAHALTSKLMNEGAEVVVLACNTATVSALGSLRRKYSVVKFVGTVPAVKVCAAESQTGNIGVLCTPKTAESKYQKDLINKFANGKNVLIRACPGLIEAIEEGRADFNSLDEYLYFFKDKNIDSLALGCSHFPLIRAEIQNYLGSGVSVVDPAHAIAKQVKRVARLAEKDGKAGKNNFYTTGDNKQFDIMINRYTGLNVRSKTIDI